MAASIHITKPAAAQRQIDAAIRIYFSDEDQLAIHSIVAAAYGILTSLDEKRPKSALNEVYSVALQAIVEKLQLGLFSKEAIDQGAPALKTLVERIKRKPCNFLKHADHDPHESLDTETLDTETLLMEACVLYAGLGLTRGRRPIASSLQRA